MLREFYSKEYIEAAEVAKSIALTLTTPAPEERALAAALEWAKGIDGGLTDFEHRGVERELLSLLGISGSRSGNMPWRVSKCTLEVVVSNFIYLQEEGVADPLALLRDYPYLATHDIKMAGGALAGLGFCDPICVLKEQCELVGSAQVAQLAEKVQYYRAFGITLQQLECNSKMLTFDLSTLIAPRLGYLNMQALPMRSSGEVVARGLAPIDILDADDEEFVAALQRHGIKADIHKYRTFAEKSQKTMVYNGMLSRNNGLGVRFEDDMVIDRAARLHQTQIDAHPRNVLWNAMDIDTLAQIRILARVLANGSLNDGSVENAVLSAREIDLGFRSFRGSPVRMEAKKTLLHGLGMLDILKSTGLDCMLRCSLAIIASNFAYLRELKVDDPAGTLCARPRLARYNIRRAAGMLDEAGFRKPLDALLKYTNLAGLNREDLAEKLDYLGAHGIWLEYVERHTKILTCGMRSRMMPRFEYLHAKLDECAGTLECERGFRLDPEYMLRVDDYKFVDLLRLAGLHAEIEDYTTFAAQGREDKHLQVRPGRMMAFDGGRWVLLEKEKGGRRPSASYEGMLRNAKG